MVVSSKDAAGVLRILQVWCMLPVRLVLLLSVITTTHHGCVVLAFSSSTLQQELQRQAADIVSSFRPNDAFNPPFWLRNPHVQTIGGFLWREKIVRNGSYLPQGEPIWMTLSRLLDRQSASLLSSQSSNIRNNNDNNTTEFWHYRERVETPDGDWFHADSRSHQRRSTEQQQQQTAQQHPITVIIVHGLESNTNSPVVQQMALAFEQQISHSNTPIHVVGLNFRGCSEIPNDTLGGYHLGFTQDLKHYLDLLRQRTSGPVYLTGFSLGANVVLKCLGELGATAVTDYNIAGAAVLAAPLDQRRNAPRLAKPGINRSVYSQTLMRTMKERVQYSVDRFCHGNVDTTVFDYHRAMKAQNIMELKNAFLAPVFGFRDCWDYYDQTSSIHFLDTIAVPTLILNAEDDPFFDSSVWPVEKTAPEGGPVPLVMVRTRYGGHLGYIGHQVAVDDDDDDDQAKLLQDPDAPSWAALELGRYLRHVHNQHQQLLASEVVVTKPCRADNASCFVSSAVTRQ